MKTLQGIFLRVLFTTALSGMSFAALSAGSELTAEEAVDGYITSLLAQVIEIQALYETDQPRYFSEVEASLDSFVDFNEVARGVMAKYGTGENGATPEQMSRFAGVFRASLVDFYGSALAAYKGGDFKFVENRRAPKNPEKATNVRMKVKVDGSDIEIQYTMFLTDERVWKLKNLYVEGINLRRQYYSRFDNLMLNNNYDIDAVIDRWQLDE